MKVVFATPSYGATPSIEYQRSSVRTQWWLMNNGAECVWLDLPGDPYVHKARNRLSSGFLRQYTDADCIFFIDDDVGWEAEDALRLMHSPEDIVCGIYPKKSDKLEFPVEIAVENGKVIEKNGLYKAALAPTGFMRIKRAALERCAEDSGKYPEFDREGNVDWCWDIFRTGFVADEITGKIGRWWGEDYFFSVMCHHLGIDIWIDPNCNFTHRGGKAWSACFKDTLDEWVSKNNLSSTLTMGVAA